MNSEINETKRDALGKGKCWAKKKCDKRRLAGSYQMNVRSKIFNLLWVYVYSKINKASIASLDKFIKLSGDHISKVLTEAFNYSSPVQVIMPDILKVFRVTLIDKGEGAGDPSYFYSISTLYSFAQTLCSRKFQRI